MTQTDLDYYRRRAREERALADQSIDARIAAVHSTMADRYGRLLNTQPQPARLD